ncbi:MAG: trigger factor [Bacteroidota bacterium]|nr:trigger factor [Bacteroidota bacterium]
MKITKTKISKIESTIHLVLEKKDYINQYESKLKELKKRANLKGFRPGMVPIQLLKKMYGKGVLFEELNKIVSNKINSYIKDEKIKIIGEPIPQGNKLEDTNIDNIENFDFDFKIGHLSNFKTESFTKKSKYTLHKIKVEKKIVDETIKNLQTQYANIENLKKVTNKSSVYGEISYDNKTKKTLLEIEELDNKETNKIIGKSINDIISIDLLKLTKSNNEKISQILGEKMETKNSPNKVSIKIENIIERSPAMINSELFDKLFGIGKIKTIKEFNNEIKKSLSANYLRESELLLNREIENNLVSKYNIEVPTNYVKDWITKNNDEKTSKKLLTQQFEQYCNQIKWSYIVDDIVDKNSIKIENEEIISLAKHQIQNQLQGSGLQEVNQDINKFVDNYLKHNNGENYLKIFNQLKSNKVFNLIKEKVSISEKSITFDKFKLLAKKIN